LPIYQAVIQAIVQGLAEFLPISSSAHLILTRWLLGWPDPGLTFDVALHGGTLVSVAIYFWSTWIGLLRAGLGGHVRRSTFASAESASHDVLSPEEIRRERSLFWMLVIATIPGAIAGKLLEDRAEDVFRTHIAWIAAALIVVGLIMWAGDVLGRKNKPLAETSMTDAIVIGLAQMFALFPGVSRSGSTITAGLFRDMSRDAAARFSFLLSTPIIAGAALLKLVHVIRYHELPPEMRAPFAVGIVVSGVVGYAAIAVLIRYLRTHSLNIFVAYRVIFGIIVLALALHAR
jgi:undecaprenyl-diphosphatase